MPKPKEEIVKEWQRINYIKQIVYGFGIPPKSAKEYWADRSRLEKEYTNAKT